MKILLVNDDGIQSVGINVLAETFGTDFDIYVIAPDGERSAYSHAVSIYRDIRYTEVFLPNVLKAYSISGTPADCTKLGVLKLLSSRPDLVISGINNGPNLGCDIMYSGTVAAAIEAAYLGIPAIAVSLTDWNCKKEQYGEAASYLKKHISALIRLQLPTDTILNINYPANGFKGTRFTQIGTNLYSDYYADTGINTVRLEGLPLQHDLNPADCDVELSKLGYCTISPVKRDRNDRTVLKNLKDITL